MPLREPRFKGIVELMKRRIDANFRELATAGFQLADSYLQLHAKGLCYRDISFGNVFFDPQSGEVRICDNDNVDINGEWGGIAGTPRFMAPEIVMKQAQPSTQTDLFSLSVLLCYMLMMHHPLEGARELSIHCLDFPAMKRLYGTEALFIFDPADPSNAPVFGQQDNPLVFWPIYPQFLRELFTRAFTDGIRDPRNGRVREGEWRAAMTRLRDSIFYCACGAENCFDMDVLQSAAGAGTCWSCGCPLALPPRIRINKHVVMLNHDTKLYPHHIDNQQLNNFATPVAEISRHPQDPNIWGLKNLTNERWVATLPDGTVKDVEPGRNVTIAVGVKINFGRAEGEIRV